MFDLAAFQAELRAFMDTIFEHIVPLLASEAMLQESQREFVQKLNTYFLRLRNTIDEAESYSKESVVNESNFKAELFLELRGLNASVIGYSDLLLGNLPQENYAPLSDDLKPHVLEIRQAAREIANRLH
jgi:hypothetical protein